MGDSGSGFMVLRGNSNSLGMSLYALREADELCDIVIVVGDEKIKAHQNVLSARSSVFKAMICGSFKESDQHEIKLRLPSLTGSAVSDCIEYLYTGGMKISKQVDLNKLKDILHGENDNLVKENMPMKPVLN